MTWVVQIDPSSAITGRTMLDLNSDAGSIKVDVAGIDWGTTASTNQEAQNGVWGSSVAAKTYPNRTVNIPIMIGASQTDTVTTGEAARRQLNQKIGLLKRRGGVLLRQRVGGPRVYADIVDADLPLPDQFGETGGFETATLSLEVLPDEYGDEITLDTITVSTSAHNTFAGKLQSSGADAVIQGDYPARCRLVVTNSSGHDQHGGLWAYQSQNASTATSAALRIPASSMTALNGAATTGTSTGSYNTNTCSYTTLANNLWTSILATTLSTGPTLLSHQGTFRVWARTQQVGAVSWRLLWGQGSLSVPVANDAMTAIPNSTAWQLVDLGVIRIEPTTDGSAAQWVGVLQVLDNGNASLVAADEFYFQPIDEGAGQLASVAVPSPAGVLVDGYATTGTNVVNGTSVAWTNPSFIAGGPNNAGSPALTSAGHTWTTSETTEFAVGGGYGFAIPSGAVILGVQVDVYAQLTAGVFFANNGTAKLAKAGAMTGSAGTLNRLVGGATGGDTILTYGGPTDLWGATLAASDVNNSGFGAGWSFTATNGTVAYVDAIAVFVWYRLNTGLTVAQDAVIYASQSLELASDHITREDSTGTVNGPVTTILGDLPRMPAAGLESLPVWLFYRTTQSDFDTVADAAADSLTIVPHYRPGYINRA